jgi:hypothetical protein
MIGGAPIFLFAILWTFDTIEDLFRQAKGTLTTQ